MSTVLAKAAHSLYFWAATPKIPTAFYFDKQNQHVFAEFKQENCPRKNKTVKQYQQFEPNCSAVSPKLLSSLAKLLSSFPQTAQQFGSNCSAVSPKLLSSLGKLLSSFTQTAQQFGQTAEQFPPNCSAVFSSFTKLLSSLVLNC